MTSNHTADPLLTSLANLKKDFKSKVSNHAFMLLALLPVPQFQTNHSELQDVLENHLIYSCLLHPKTLEAAAFSTILSYPWQG